MNNGMNSSTAVNNPSLQAAAKAAAQINAQLAAEGKFPTTLLNSPTNNTSAQKKQEANIKKAPKSGRKDLYSSEVEINHLPPRVRNLLTKGYIQEQLQWKSKAALCTKGRYISPRDKSSPNLDDRPLYICIQAVDKQAVDEAILQIQQFISEHTNNSSPTSASSSSAQPNNNVVHPNIPPPQIISLVKDKVYISLDHAPESFKLVERVLGSGGDNISYIQTETGVSVSLQGRGTSHPTANDEPLHLLLEHVDSNAVQSARSLALSLVGTLAQDFVQWQREQQLMQQQQQQQFLYTLSQPYSNLTYSNGPSAASGNYHHYPALATMVYSHVDHHGLNQVPSSHQNTAQKRPSRFDHHQPTTGSNSATGNWATSDTSTSKRQKMNYPPHS